MPRPRTTGPTIQFRLPLEAHADVARRAAEQGLSIPAWCRAQLLDGLHAPAAAPLVETRRTIDARAVLRGNVEPRFKK